jgi:thioredoxin reductase
VRRTDACSYRLRRSDGGALTARSVVITTGVTYRRLGVPRQPFGRKL